jgi:hypothetical protein
MTLRRRVFPVLLFLGATSLWHKTEADSIHRRSNFENRGLPFLPGKHFATTKDTKVTKEKRPKIDAFSTLCLLRGLRG